MSTSIVIGRKNGTLADVTPVDVPVHEIVPPMTVFVRNAAPFAHQIEISVDGGYEFFEPIYDFESATQKAVSVGTPITHVRFSGTTDSVWGVL